MITGEYEHIGIMRNWEIQGHKLPEIRPRDVHLMLQCSVDLFPDRTNFQQKMYFIWKEEQYDQVLDAMIQPWRYINHMIILK